MIVYDDLTWKKYNSVSYTLCADHDNNISSMIHIIHWVSSSGGGGGGLRRDIEVPPLA